MRFLKNSPTSQFTDFDVHTVCFQLCVSALGDRDPHEIQTGDHLILCELVLITHLLNIPANVQVRSYFLHIVFLINKFRNKESSYALMI